MRRAARKPHPPEARSDDELTVLHRLVKDEGRRDTEVWRWLYDGTTDSARKKGLALEALRTCINTALVTSDQFRAVLEEFPYDGPIHRCDFGERVRDAILAKSDLIKASIPRWVAAEILSLMREFDGGRSLDELVGADAAFRRKARSAQRHGRLRTARLYERFEERVGEGETIDEYLYDRLAKEFGLSSRYLARKLIDEERERRETKARVEAKAALEGTAIGRVHQKLSQLSQPITEELVDRLAREYDVFVPDFYASCKPFIKRDVRVDVATRKALYHLEELEQQSQLTADVFERIAREHDISPDDLYDGLFWERRLWKERRPYKPLGKLNNTV
jgi:hypothetical protein